MEPGTPSRGRIVTNVVVVAVAALILVANLEDSDGPVQRRSPASVAPRATGTLVSGPSPDCDHPPVGPVSVAQDRFDGPAGMVATWFDHEQAIAQTFTAPADLRLVEIAPTFDYALGEGARISVHAVTDPRDPMSGAELMRARLDALAMTSGEPSRIRLEPAVAVECEGLYSIVIRPALDSELAIEATAAGRTGNVYVDGAMFMGRPGHWDATGGDMRFVVAFAPA